MSDPRLRRLARDSDSSDSDTDTDTAASTIGSDVDTADATHADESTTASASVACVSAQAEAVAASGLRAHKNEAKNALDPAVVPKSGQFYMHDDRGASDADEAPVPRRRSAADVDDVWKHDRFETEVANPKAARGRRRKAARGGRLPTDRRPNDRARRKSAVPSKAPPQHQNPQSQHQEKPQQQQQQQQQQKPQAQRKQQQQQQKPRAQRKQQKPPQQQQQQKKPQVQRKQQKPPPQQQQQEPMPQQPVAKASGDVHRPLSGPSRQDRATEPQASQKQQQPPQQMSKEISASAAAPKMNPDAPEFVCNLPMFADGGAVYMPAGAPPEYAYMVSPSDYLAPAVDMYAASVGAYMVPGCYMYENLWPEQQQLEALQDLGNTSSPPPAADADAEQRRPKRFTELSSS